MRLTEEPISRLGVHGEVPIAFLVERVLDVRLVQEGLGGVVLSERAVETPWLKDYDAIRGEGPAQWARRFDVTNWGLIAAQEAARRVGGAVVAFDTAGVSMLGGAAISPSCGTSGYVPRPARRERGRCCSAPWKRGPVSGNAAL